MQPKPMRAVYNTPMRRSLLLCSWLTNEFAKFTNRQNQSVRYAFYYVYVCPTSAPRGFRYGYRRYKGNIFISYSFFFYRQNVFLWSDLTLLNTNISKKSTFTWIFLLKSLYYQGLFVSLQQQNPPRFPFEQRTKAGLLLFMGTLDYTLSRIFLFRNKYNY